MRAAMIFSDPSRSKSCRVAPSPALTLTANRRWADSPNRGVRQGAALEAAAYFVLAESLTNVAKHARAEHAAVTVREQDATLHVAVRDDGVGGARADGSGLVGLADRVAALKGRVRIESGAGEGTHVVAEIPVPD